MVNTPPPWYYINWSPRRDSGAKIPMGPSRAPGEHPFTSSRRFLSFWETNTSSGCSSQKCTDMCMYCLTHSSRRFIYSWKPIPGTLHQYLDVNNGPVSAVAMEQWANLYSLGEKVLKNVAVMNDLEFDQPSSLLVFTNHCFLYRLAEPAWGLSQSPPAVQVE